MTTVKITNGRIDLRAAIGLLGLFVGACALFALIATASDAWQEHAQKNWPVVTATIQRCDVEPYYPFNRDGGGVVWNIECRIAYTVDGQQTVSRIRSRSARADTEVGRMRRWVAQHRPGSSMIIHYDPAHSTHAALTETDMPFAGPRTPNNLKLLLTASVICAVLLAVSWSLRNRT